MISEKTYSFGVYIARFRDGDTLEGFLRCGCCDASTHVVIRLPSIDSWELDAPERALALEVARSLTATHRGALGVLAAGAIRRDCYGRVIGDVLIDGHSLTMQIVEAGMAWWGVNTPEPVGFVRFGRKDPATLTAAESSQT